MLRIQHIICQGQELNIVQTLFTEYATELKANLSFQNFDKEVENPLLKYAPPFGSLLLAYYNNQPVGCVALQTLPQSGCCEMKRLYVQPHFRKYKIGEALVVAILDQAKQLGYTTMKLDTLQRLQPAIKLYSKYGFAITNAYYENPLEEVVYMERKL